MTELERALVALAGDIDVPRAPELARAVAARIARRRRVLRLGVALAFVLAALAAVLAVPSARSELLRIFHLRGATVERVDAPPAGRERELGRSLGVSLPLAEAERRLGFRLLLPPGARPEHARVYDGLGSVVLERDGGPFVLSEFRASGFEVMKKVASEGTLVGPVQVGAEPGIWIEGSPHVLYFVTAGGPLRGVPIAVSGNVLLWQHGALTLRLQGPLTRREAVAVARSVR